MLAGLDWQSFLKMPQFAIAGGLLVGFLIAMTGIISHYWFQAKKLRSDNELRRSLVEQGLTVDEIERIMAAGHKDESED